LTLKNGEKGVVIQRDGESYAISPHTPCGIITPDLLRKIADVAEKYNTPVIKITSANRIGLIGVKEEDVDNMWADLGMSEGHLVGMCVRSVRACPGDQWCKLGQRDSLGLGMKLDKTYHGMELPNKLKIAVSGCPINCAEGWVRDIGFYAQGKSKWVMLVGGNIGSRPRMANELTRGLDDDEAIEATAKVVEFYKNNAKKSERVGRMIERLGLEPLKELVA
jgi:NAD(P)H-nitrite reductase large subunit